MKRLIIGLLFITLTGCTGLTGNLGNDLSGLANFTKADLQAALDDAKKNGDVAGANCWSTLLGVVGNVPSGLPVIKGVASAMQARRDLLGSHAAGDLAKQINIGCAAMFIDDVVTAAKLAGMASGLPLPIPLP